MRSNAYTFGFMTAVCVACSLLVSLSAIGLRAKQQINEEVDVQRNILRSVGLPESPDERLTPEQVQQLFKERIDGIVVENDGDVVEGKEPEDIDPEEQQALEDSGQDYQLRVYLRKDGDAIVAYTVPVSGKGLWSTIYGYFALGANATTVKGITFYKHGETPGLGAEIEKTWFQNQFKGKKIVDENGKDRTITVVKAGTQIPPEQAPYCVDGISGATLTCKGVTALLKDALKDYDPYFDDIREAHAEDAE